MRITVVDSDGKVLRKETLQQNLRNAAAVVKRQLQRAFDWVMCHKTEALAILGALVMLGKKFIKPAGIRHKEQERERIDTTYYDPSTGLHWQLTRKPTNAERAEFAERKRAGEPAEMILDDLDLLK